MWPYRENQLITIIIGAVVFVFFLALTVYSYRQGQGSEAIVLVSF